MGDLDTTGATAPNQIAGVAMDAAAGRVYWANAGSGKISYANLDGSGGGGDLNTSGATVGGVRGLTIDPHSARLYWGNSAGIWYANLDDSGGGPLATGTASVMFPWGVAVDPADNRIYWANFNLSVTPTNKISYTALDGSGGGADLAVDRGDRRATQGGGDRRGRRSRLLDQFRREQVHSERSRGPTWTGATAPTSTSPERGPTAAPPGRRSTRPTTRSIGSGRTATRSRWPISTEAAASAISHRLGDDQRADVHGDPQGAQPPTEPRSSAAARRPARP